MLRMLVETTDQFSLQRLKILDSHISNPTVNLYAPHLGTGICLLLSQSELKNSQSKAIGQRSRDREDFSVHGSSG